MVVMSGTASGDAVAWFVETSELLEIDVDEFAGMTAAVPALGWLEV